MLPLKNRLRRKKDFDRIYQQGIKMQTDLFVLYRFSNNQDHSRFGIVVSNKISKKATQRNKIKRRIRAAIRQVANLNAGQNYILIAKPKTTQASFTIIKKNIEDILSKLK